METIDQILRKELKSLPDPVFSQNAMTILEKRYLMKDDSGATIETPKEMLWRVATTMATVEFARHTSKEDSNMAVVKWAKEFYSMMCDMKFLPNSPCLMNAGKKNGQLSACFVLPIEDSITSIFDTVKYTACIHKTGGGTGFDFSDLRPAGSLVGSTSGVASGPVSFMKIFDAATEQIKQGGVRRGANMGILRVDHPDIKHFITCKNKEGVLNNFNISVAITDDFMKALKNGGNYSLRDPHTGMTCAQSAQEIWDMIVDNAWATGDPGVIFIDEMNRHNPTPWIGQFASTNPCVTGDTEILTDKGYVRIDTVVDQQVNVWNGHEWSEVMVKQTGENQDILDIEFSNGVTLSCTPYHKFILTDGQRKSGDGERIEAKDLVVGKSRLAKVKFPVIEGGKTVSSKFAYTQGFYSGDGTEGTTDGIYLYGEKMKLTEFLAGRYVNTYKTPDRKCLRINWSGPKNLKSKSFVPDTRYSVQTRLDWLAGLIDADGSKNGPDGGMSISSVNKPFLIKVQRLLHTLGVPSTLARSHEAGLREWPDGRVYPSQDCYRVTWSGYSTRELRKLGLCTHRLSTDGEPNRDASRFVYPTKITPRKEKAGKVYCFTEPKNHSGIFNGMYTANCGEQVLLPFEACSLGSINLSKFVNADRTGFDENALKETLRTVARFMDNMIERNSLPLPEIAEAVHKTRKVGVGVMGWADALFMMGIPYSSNEAAKLAKYIMSLITHTLHRESEILAKLFGAFPCAKDVTKEYSKKTKYHEICKRRNATSTTIAPTGTLSMLADCSSGIEPVFALSMTKVVMDGTPFVYLNPYFKEHLRERYPNALCKNIETELTKYGMLTACPSVGRLDKKTIDLFQTAQEITPEAHLRMQAAFQYGTDNAVSKTINLPNSATREDIGFIYLEAYARECKGVTIYRDGCKSEQVLYTGDRKDSPKKEVNSGDSTENTPVEAAKPARFERPDELHGITRRIRLGSGTLYLTVNETERGVPVEVFATLGKSGADTAANAEAIGRCVSFMLRYGVPIGDIVNQLKGIGGEAPTFNHFSEAGKSRITLSIADAIAKCLEDRYLTKAVSSTASTVQHEHVDVDPRSKCPVCGGKLARQEGCMSCFACGYSKCS